MANTSLLDENRKSGAIKLQIVPPQPKTLSHLPSRPAVDLAFHDLVYSVREGHRNRKLFFFLFFVCFLFANLIFNLTIHTFVLCKYLNFKFQIQFFFYLI